MICLYVLIVLVPYGIRHKSGTGLWNWILVFRFQNDENPFVCFLVFFLFCAI